MRLPATIIAAALLAGAASAQAPPKSADPRTRLEIAEFTGCLARNRRQDARRAVLEQWDSAKLVYRELLEEQRCFPKARYIRFDSGVVRAGLANHLILLDLEAADIARVPTAPPLPADVPGPPKTTDSKGRPLTAAAIAREQDAIGRRMAALTIDRFGECIARTNPAAVPVLAATPVASPAEVEALKAFGPQMPQCLTRGVRLELDRSSLRGAITLGYYRLAMAARQAPVQGVVQ